MVAASGARLAGAADGGDGRGGDLDRQSGRASADGRYSQPRRFKEAGGTEARACADVAGGTCDDAAVCRGSSTGARASKKSARRGVGKTRRRRVRAPRQIRTLDASCAGAFVDGRIEGDAQRAQRKGERDRRRTASAGSCLLRGEDQ